MSTNTSSALTIAHAADVYRCYPGETVTFYTRVSAHVSLPGLTLRITLPEQFVLETSQATLPALNGRNGYGTSPQLEMGAGVNFVIYEIDHEVPAGAGYEYQTRVRIVPTKLDTVLECRAVATARPANRRPISVEETVAITVLAKGTYLKYLPALYQEDELMGRFLMLFESFWAPLEAQLGHIPFYFDPRMTTPDFLAWLASWIDLALDERWPEEKRRRLLRAAALLYRKRGTKRGLQEYLEIYTDETAEIIEHRAENFRLGVKAKLGPGIALGTGNLAHTFTVALRLPLIPLTEEGGEEERARQEQLRQRTIEAIIEAGKPAHTSYRLDIENVSRAEHAAQPELK